MSIFKLLLTIPGCGWFIGKIFKVHDERLGCNFLGLSFQNPVGLAAGFDKNAQYLDIFDIMGFGFVEIGTVTPKQQDGNPSPRLFRLPEDRALINRMGFNNSGMDVLVKNLQKKRPPELIVGGNIGKNKATPNEAAAGDYIQCFEALYPYVDYFVVNVSSPNTPHLRDLQEKEPLRQLLFQLQTLNDTKITRKPILLKIAPDLSDNQLDDIIDIVESTGIAGIVATNTTISRAGLTTKEGKIREIGEGGLSGAPLRERSTEIIRYLHKKSKGKIFIIGVGGIDSPTHAIEKLKAGASLIQIYTGLIYEGPSLIKRINKALLHQK
jgi:dihydroorotate dehydrogenase